MTPSSVAPKPDARSAGVSATVPRREPLAGPLYALTFRNFRLFAAGQLVSLAGTWTQMVAQQWLVAGLAPRRAAPFACGLALPAVAALRPLLNLDRAAGGCFFGILTTAGFLLLGNAVRTSRTV